MTNRYWIVVEEWNYNTESGRNVVDDFDTEEQALEKCLDLAETEIENFEHFNGVDSIGPDRITDGYILSPKNGLDRFFYVARIVPVNAMY